MTEQTKVDKIEAVLKSHSAPRFRLTQVVDALYKKGTTNFDDISALPAELRQVLKGAIGDILSLQVISHTEGVDSTKVLFKTKEGNPVESVLMKYKEHSTLCVSSQSGCALNCVFCATGAMGFKANLTADEICDQILYFVQKGQRPDNIVFMGMGEPFANPNFFDALELVVHPDVFGYGQRKISISTVGLIPGIQKVSQLYQQVNLSFSLHSPFTEQRNQLMPVTKAYPVEKVFGALNQHINLTHRKVFIAYLLIKGVNDTAQHAEELAKLIRAQGSGAYLYNVNLIRYHDIKIEGKDYKPSDVQNIKKFYNILMRNQVHTTVRQNFGEEIDAACGQLAAKNPNEK